MAGKAPVYNLTLGEEFGGINRRRPGRPAASDANPATGDGGSHESPAICDGPAEPGNAASRLTGSASAADDERSMGGGQGNGLGDDLGEVCAEGPDGLPSSAHTFKPETPAQDVPASERIAALLDKMPSHRALMFKIILACENPMQVGELNAFVEDLQRFDRSVFGPVELCGLLQRAGALELVDGDGTPYGRASLPADAPVADERADEPGSATGAAEAEAAEEPAEGLEEGESEEEGDPDSTGDADTARPAFWAATEAGLTAARSDDPFERLASLFRQNETYASVYKCILSLCARDGGAKTPALGKAVDSVPVVWHPRLFATHFVDQLEKCGAIQWRGAWCATEVGLSGLELLRGVEDVEIPQDLDQTADQFNEFDYEMPALQ